MSNEQTTKLEPTQELTALNKEEEQHVLPVLAEEKRNTTATKGGLKIGDTINNRFVLEEELGRGGMGVVFKAKDLRKEEARDRNPYIALKVLSEEFKNNPDSFIALQRETRKTQELAHPNIITVYDFDKDGDHIYMTMECLEGKPLSTLLREQYFLSCPLTKRWSIIRQISLAIANAHQKNIIHLDIKPSNIYMKDDGTVKVLDFGIARVVKKVDISKTSQDITVFDVGSLGALTPSYASCEMLENQDPDFRDDIYSLACVTYEILTNQHPFNRMQATHACLKNITPPPIPEITKKQYKALIHGLAFNREERITSIEQFLQKLQLNNIDNQTRYTSSWKLLNIILLCLVFSAIFWLGYSQFYQSKTKLFIKDSSAILTPATTTLSMNQQKKISRLLDIAEMHFVIGRLVEPLGTNALEAYNSVLLIHPENKTALKGINEIASYYDLLSRELWNKGKTQQSIEMLDKGLLASPQDKDLLQFKETSYSDR